MHWRAVRMWRVILIGALASEAISSSTNDSRNRLSPHSSCTSAGGARRASHMSTTAGNSSMSAYTACARSSAWARLGAMQAAINSPTWRTLPRASGHWSEALKPARLETARIGLTPGRSSMVNTAASRPAGFSMALRTPCAIGERANATSHMPASRRSPTNCPCPAISRRSSLRGTLAPTPWAAPARCFTSLWFMRPAPAAGSAPPRRAARRCAGRRPASTGDLRPLVFLHCRTTRNARARR